MAWIQGVYSKNDLTKRLQTIGSEKQLSKNLWRGLLVALNLVSVVLIVQQYDLNRLRQYFTNWTLLVTILYLLVAITASGSKSLGLLAFHHILFETALLMNIVVVTVYWSCLHTDSRRECEGNSWKILNCYWAHIVPFASILANFYFTDVVV